MATVPSSVNLELSTMASSTMVLVFATYGVLCLELTVSTLLKQANAFRSKVTLLRRACGDLIKTCTGWTLWSGRRKDHYGVTKGSVTGQLIILMNSKRRQNKRNS